MSIIILDVYLMLRIILSNNLVTLIDIQLNEDSNSYLSDPEFSSIYRKCTSNH